MMGGPISIRAETDSVNDHALNRPIEWFRRSAAAYQSPINYRGAGRRVIPALCSRL
jgi:poly(3-hydroxybutyrate) depolymerase